MFRYFVECKFWKTKRNISTDRVKINAKGQVELKLKTPWRDGTTHHVMSPLEFMQRLAATDCQEPLEHGRPMRLGWAKLLKRVFNLDLTHCPHCGGQLRIVAAILQRQAIEKILNHLGLDPQPPPRAPARGQMAF
jgi:hypothetical protein